MGDFLYICIVLIYSFLSFCFMDVYLVMSSFSLWHMSSELEVYFGFTNDVSQHTGRLTSTSWVIFTPGGQFLSTRGIHLGDATNNVVQYSAVI